MNKLDVDPIKARYFYNNDDEKIKLNWFCYEYSFMLYSKLREGIKFKKYRERNTQGQIVDFCVYFSKEIKKSIYEKLGRLVDKTTFYEEYVASYYPKNSSKENLLLLAAAMQAWDELFDSCVSCPTRCISEMHRKCNFFDEIDEDE